MRVLMLSHERASSVTPRTLVQIHTALASQHEVTVTKTHLAGAAERLARSAAVDGFDAVAVLGGDGTLNDAANGLAGTRCALAALPGGSTNVFARSIGTPDDPVAAAHAVARALSEGAVSAVALGRVAADTSAAGDAAPATSRYFLNSCGVGFDAAVVRWVERHPRLKRYASHSLYLAAATGTWVQQRFRASATLEVEQLSDAARLVVVANNDPYTYLGNRPVSIAPAAGLTERLSVVAVGRLRVRQATALARAALSTLPEAVGALDADTLARADGLERVTITAVTDGEPPRQPAFDYQVDGEYLGRAHQVTVTHVPEVLRLVRVA